MPGTGIGSAHTTPYERQSGLTVGMSDTLWFKIQFFFLLTVTEGKL